MAFLTRVEALKDLLQEAIDKGAHSVEQIHKTIAAMPLSALKERGLLSDDVAEKPDISAHVMAVERRWNARCFGNGWCWRKAGIL